VFKFLFAVHRVCSTVRKWFLNAVYHSVHHPLEFHLTCFQRIPSMRKFG